jgi:diguanylate cyclase (GGDEF)-like protein/PAS domain S-box-containing protein
MRSTVHNATPSGQLPPGQPNASRPLDMRIHVPQLVDEAGTGLLVLDISSEQVRYANPRLAEMLARSVDEILGTSAFELIDHQDRDLVRENLRRRLRGEPIAPYEIRGLRKDGTVFAALIDGHKIEIDSGFAVLVTVTDLTEYKRVSQENEENTHKVARLELLSGAALLDLAFPEGRITASSGLCALIGAAEKSPQAACQLDACPWIPSSDLAIVSAFWRNAVPGQPFEFQHRVVRADGRQITVRHRGILEVKRDVRHGTALLQDITAQVDAERRLQELAARDELTGLPNRTSIAEAIGIELHSAKRESRELCLFVIRAPMIAQLDNSLGFGAGNTLAMAIAARLQEACGQGQRLARIGESEFTVLVNPEQSRNAEALIAYAQVIRAALWLPATIGTTEVLPRCVIGIARYPDHADDAKALLHHAQTAARQAEHDPERSIRFFGSQENDVAARSLDIEYALQHAAERGELRLVYQPRANLTTGEITGVEALLRWQSPRFGEISPSEFIPLAERSDAIRIIGEWVLHEVCRQAIAWRTAGLRAPRISVNVSSREISRPSFAARVQAIALECNCDPSWLGMEVAENALMDDSGLAAAVLRDLKAIGFEIALDDFGTGLSSLSRLHQLPVDVVHIDRSLIPDVLVSPELASITRAIITMSHSLKMRVLAKGVETEDQLKLLATNACDAIQGNYFSGPVEAAAIEAMLREERKLPEPFLNGPAKDRTLLLVDDEENIISALKRLLRRDGYRIVVAHNASDALKCLSETHVDVILSDQRMPGVSGVEFLRHAKELYPDTVRMVLSGFTDLQSVIDAVNEGAVYKFLTKPWDDEKLRARIAEAFQLKKMADDNQRLARELETANANFAAVNERLQHSLATQCDQAEMLTRAADGSREILESLPAFIIGIGPDNVVAFVNGDPELVEPEIGGAIGSSSSELPPPLQDVLRTPDGGAHAVEINANRYLVYPRTMRSAGSPNSRLLVLFPMKTPAAGACA